MHSPPAGSIAGWRAALPGAGTWIAVLALLASLRAFPTLTFEHLAYPLIWQDERDTLMFAKRVFE